jgi:FKBP-type peptidyl-prolyl cis-trans isomerase FklB
MFRKYLYVIVALLFVATANAQKDKNKDKEKNKDSFKLGSLKDSAGYAIGYNVGQTVIARFPGIELTTLIRGLTDAYKNGDTLIPIDQITNLITTYTKNATQLEAAEAKAAGEKFLKENALKQGVITTASGLQYVVLKEGSGPKPIIGNKVKVHYAGTLINGKEFDNSYKRGQPAEFDITGVIKGWTEALQLMSVGSKFKLFIPSELAYGANGMNGVIPPSSVLIFEVELLGIL